MKLAKKNPESMMMLLMIIIMLIVILVLMLTTTNIENKEKGSRPQGRAVLLAVIVESLPYRRRR